jgi:hypothetical protein
MQATKMDDIFDETQWQASQPYQLAGPRGTTDRKGHL